jgi:hypothetical protein
MMASTLEMLLKRLAAERAAPLPDPAAPVGLGQLSNDTALAFGAQNPQPVPPQITQPAAPDQGFVNQFAGPAPTAPVQNDPSFLDKLGAVLSGIAAGPGYAQQLREERQRPIKEYNAAQERYQGRRAQGIELAERRAEREADRTTRALEQQYENEYKKWLAKNNDRSDESKLRMQQAFQLERDARHARLEAEREQQRERRQLERDARAIEERYFTASKNRGLSRELGRHWSGLSDAPLSPAAARLDAKLQRVGEARMGGGGGTGGGSSSAAQNTLAEFETLKQMAIQGVKAAGGTPEDEVEAVRRATTGVVRKMARQPRLFEVGMSPFGYPYAQPRGAAPVPAETFGASPQGFPLAFGQQGGPQRAAPAATPKRGEAKRKLVKGGFSSKEADAELDRLGIR